jgi:hypothetical protein
MRTFKKYLLLFLAVIMVTALTAIATLRGQEQTGVNANAADQQREEFESQFPVADFQPDTSPHRRAKGKRYDGAKNAIGENIEVVSSSRHWAEGLPALPVQQSDAIVIGQVKKAEAFVTDERTAVYSEFEVQVSDILKNDGGSPLILGSSLTAGREGGRVRTPSGRIGIFFTNGMGLPRVGKRYVLFLSHQFPYGDKQDGDFYIVTAYELKAGSVYPIDNPGGGTHPIARKYKDADEVTFLEDLQRALHNQQ